MTSATILGATRGRHYLGAAMTAMHLSHAPSRRGSLRRTLLRLAVPALAVGAGVAIAPATALGFHTDITGTASCLAANGSYTVSWTVTVPNESWAIGYTATLAGSVPRWVTNTGIE